jgi:hypothetical protein
MMKYPTVVMAATILAAIAAGPAKAEGLTTSQKMTLDYANSKKRYNLGKEGQPTDGNYSVELYMKHRALVWVRTMGVAGPLVDGAPSVGVAGPWVDGAPSVGAAGPLVDEAPSADVGGSLGR